MFEKTIISLTILLAISADCQTYKSGIEKFRKDFMTAIHYVSEDYVIYGKMDFLLNVNEEGVAE